MAKKTAIKRLLKFAPLKADSLRAIAIDKTIKIKIAVDMTEIRGKPLLEENLIKNSISTGNDSVLARYFQ